MGTVFTALAKLKNEKLNKEIQNKIKKLIKFSNFFFHLKNQFIIFNLF